MENRLKLKICKLFQTCRSKPISDVSGEPFFFPANRHHRQLIALFSPVPHSQIQIKPKNSDQTPSFSPQKTTKTKPRYRKPKKIEYISSSTDNYYYDWRSSDDENENETETESALFLSRRSFHSESSSRCFGKNRACRMYDKKKLKKKSGKIVKDSVAVEKKSSNPYEDFRVSMVEMIVEMEIFEAEDLTDLFECFISLNSDEHHRVIVEVFTEVLDALFSDLD
ncbi:hypothetical protein QVD17_23047 [Tagetes erecta]|uniref:Transcription repressor n=1 Tax=Tagetes erecta TaxID=13708 RepID=A0AAD8KDN0_TARER|nr:hypothetical protein QVD17_23047 [Tagetes erecta]